MRQNLVWCYKNEWIITDYLLLVGFQYDTAVDIMKMITSTGTST